MIENSKENTTDILKSYDASFVFLGQRRYVHGSSMTHGLFEAFKNWSLGPIQRLQVQVRSLLKKQGRYDLFYSENGEMSLGKEYNTIFRVQCTKNIYAVGLRGRGESVMVSEPYDEEELIDDCQILKNSKSATLLLQPNALVVNVIIALNKKLVSAIFPSEGYGQWFLARYDLVWEKIRLIEQVLLEIELVGNIGASNTNTAIRLGGEKIGSIYFSRKMK
jgi:hypothetical protein